MARVIESIACCSSLWPKFSRFARFSHRHRRHARPSTSPTHDKREVQPQLNAAYHPDAGSHGRCRNPSETCGGAYSKREGQFAQLRRPKVLGPGWRRAGPGGDDGCRRVLTFPLVNLGAPDCEVASPFSHQPIIQPLPLSVRVYPHDSWIALLDQASAFGCNGEENEAFVSSDETLCLHLLLHKVR